MINRILFFAEGQLGDSLVLMPALRAVRNSMRDARITVLLFYRSKYFKQSKPEDLLIQKSECRGAAEVFADNPFVDEVFEIDRQALRSFKGIKRLKAELKCINFLRKQKYDAAVCTFPQDRFVLWSFFSGIKIRIGQKKQSFGFLLTHKPDLDERSDDGVLKYFCSLLEPLGIKCTDHSPYYEVPQSSRIWMQNFLKLNNIEPAEKIVCIHPGARDRDRQLSPAQCSELIDRIAEKLPTFKAHARSGNVRYKSRILLCYGEYDSTYINEVKKNIKNNIIFLKTDSISQLAAIFQKCSLCIVHNSGPRHLAAAAGARTIGLLERNDHIMWKIYEDDRKHYVIQSEENCMYCSNNCLGKIPDGEQYGSYCMRAIRVDEIVKKVEKIL